MPSLLPTPGRAAVITGASSGIGEELARDLTRRGYQVVLVARRADRLNKLAAELGNSAFVVPVDLSQRSERATLADRIADLGLTVDILVNNAGLSTMGTVATSDPDAEVNLVEVDVAAVVDLCSRFLPGMVARGSGAVLNVASVGAFGPVPGQAGYGAAKAFVLSYTHALRGELGGTGVTAAALCPGPVDTGFLATAGSSKEEAEAMLPKFLWKSAAEVARTGVDGLAKGKAVIVPGTANRVLAAVNYLTPRAPLVRLLARTHPGIGNA